MEHIQFPITVALRMISLNNIYLFTG